MFWKVPPEMLREAGKKNFRDMASTPPYATVDLHDVDTTHSDPTYFEDGDRKYIYIGLRNGNLAVVDVTDIDNPQVVFNSPPSAIDPNISATDITSAPYITKWKGHTVAVTASGNRPWVLLWTDPLDATKRNVLKLSVRAVRTSSSPGPLEGGFLIGCDNGLDNEGYIVYWRFNDILAEDPHGKVYFKGSNFSILPTRSSAVASFAVDPEKREAYYNDSRANVYKFYVGPSGKLFEDWHYYFPGLTFTHRSPALTDSNVYVPIGTRKGLDGQGGLLVVDRNGNEVAQVYFGSKVGTAPVVWRYDEGATVIVGTQGSREGVEGVYPGETPDQTPALALLDAMDGYSKYDAVTLEELGPTGESFGTGVSGQMSIGSLEPTGHFSIMALTHANGVYVWAMLPLDIKAEIVDTGVPAGQKAEPDQRYTAKVRFTVLHAPDELVGSWEGWVPIVAYHRLGGGNTYYQATLKDASGNEWPYSEDTYLLAGRKEYILHVTHTGQVVEAYFDWTAPDGYSETVLAAAVNMNYPAPEMAVVPDGTRLSKWLPETDYTNNVAEVKVPIRVKCDVAVKIWPPKDPFILAWYAHSVRPGVNVRVYRKDSGEPVPVKLTVNGPAGPKTFEFTLAGGQDKTVQYFFEVTSGGTWTVSAEAWPEPREMESYPPDNSASTQVNVVKNEPPPTGPREPGIHGELGDI